MKPLSSILLIGSLVFVATSAESIKTETEKNVQGTPEPKATKQEARATAERWLLALDQKQYHIAWDTFCPGMKRQLGTQEALQTILEKARTPVGSLEKRTFHQATLFRSSITGEVTHAVVEFTVSFQHQKQATEELTLMHHGENSWKVSKYRIKH